MEIKTLDDLKTVINLLAEGKAYYRHSIPEGIIELRYNQEKNCIEKYMCQDNPYSGETRESTEVKTVEELFESYKDFPDLWKDFGTLL